MGQALKHHIYRVQMPDDGRHPAVKIEFEAICIDAALHRSRELCGSRRHTLFEDGRKIADLRNVDGCWRVS